MRISWLLVLAFVLPVAAGAQETRGNISGTIRDSHGVIPGATVKITNVDTRVIQTLVTNGSGYYEAPLLIPGNYEVTAQVQGFKTATRSNIVLGVGQQVNIPFTLEVGGVSEEVNVTAQAPVLDTNSVSSGANFDTHLLESLPMFSNMPIMLARFASGVNPNDQQVQVSQGNVDNTNLAAGTALGNVNNATGSNNYTIDGANNNGTGRRLAISPNADVVQEMRIESSNFDAAVGHGSGLQVSMMTRAGTNTARGTVNYQYWSNRLNALTAQQKATFDDRAKSEFKKGRSHNISLTHGGPVHIPKLIDGRGKLFYFANYSHTNDSIPGKLQGAITVPANQKHLQGDFSDLLLLPNSATYQIYDPLTTHPDPTNPSRMIRDPFEGNIIPRDRIFNPDGTYKNPMMNLYAQMVPPPNQNFVEQGQSPTGNFYQGGQPDVLRSNLAGIRLDYNATQGDRFFFRASSLTSLAYLSDWSYLAVNPAYRIQSTDRSRYQWSFTGDWTRVQGQTVLDTQVSSNRFNQVDKFLGLRKFKPSDVGVASYVTDFCMATDDCTLPLVNITGYQGPGTGVSDADTATHIQVQSNLTTVRKAHTVRAGIDLRHAQRDRTGGGNRSGQFLFDRTYTRQASDESLLTPSNIGLSLAAFELGLPTSASINRNNAASYGNYYVGAFGQDSWRLGRLTLNAGLRFEYENGITDKNNRMITGFDPSATLAITAAAESAYLASGLQNTEGMLPSISVRGGPIYATVPGHAESWKGQGLWMPRISGAYKLTDRMVVKAGYGVYYDTLNAADFGANQNGYDVTTTNTISDDLGRTFKWGAPGTGAGGFDPFPLRADGTRFDQPIGDALGVNTILGGTYTAENDRRVHTRQQRWQLSLQRDLGASLGLEVNYTGTRSDDVSMTIRQDFLPEQYWNGDKTRNTAANAFLTTNVPNPFNIANFAALKTSDPVLYTRLASNGFFTQNTIVRHRLLRPFPQMFNSNPQIAALSFQNLPLGQVKAHSLEVALNRRFSNGLSGNATFSVNRVTSNRTVEEYDRGPTLWQTSNGARPFRLVAVGVYELPFGDKHRFLQRGGPLAALAGNWQISGSWEYQPGSLLDWPNLFFYGNLDDIKLDHPTLDRWINTDAGFEKDALKIPAAFQKRSFPFRIDGIRGQALMFTSMSIQRSFRVGSQRTIQLRVDAQNLFNRQQWNPPNLTPTSTQFGQVTTVAMNQMRFFTFITRFAF